jgi:hypothetical protein
LHEGDGYEHFPITGKYLILIALKKPAAGRGLVNTSNQDVLVGFCDSCRSVDNQESLHSPSNKNTQSHNYLWLSICGCSSYIVLSTIKCRYSYVPVGGGNQLNFDIAIQSARLLTSSFPLRRTAPVQNPVRNRDLTEIRNALHVNPLPLRLLSLVLLNEFPSQMIVPSRCKYARIPGTYGAPTIHAELADDHGVHMGCQRVVIWCPSTGVSPISDNQTDSPASDSAS